MITISMTQLFIIISVIVFLIAITRPSEGGFISMPPLWTAFAYFGILVFWIAYALKGCIH